MARNTDFKGTEWLETLKAEHRERSPKGVPRRVKLFFQALCDKDVGMVASKAAEKAGYSHGAALGSRLKRLSPKTYGIGESVYH